MNPIPVRWVNRDNNVLTGSVVQFVATPDGRTYGIVRRERSFAKVRLADLTIVEIAS